MVEVNAGYCENAEDQRGWGGLGRLLLGCTAKQSVGLDEIMFSL